MRFLAAVLILSGTVPEKPKAQVVTICDYEGKNCHEVVVVGAE